MVFESGWPTTKDFHHASAQLIGKTSRSIMGDVVQTQKAVPDRIATEVSKTTIPLSHPCGIPGSNCLDSRELSTEIMQTVIFSLGTKHFSREKAVFMRSLV